MSLEKESTYDDASAKEKTEYKWLEESYWYLFKDVNPWKILFSQPKTKKQISEIKMSLLLLKLVPTTISRGNVKKEQLENKHTSLQ